MKKNLIISNKIFRQPWIIHSGIGFLLGIGFVFPVLWLAGFFGVAGLVFVIQQQRCTWKSIWWVWFIKSLLVSSWIWALYPIEWIGLDLGVLELPIIGVYWGTVSAAVAFGGIIFYWLIRLGQVYLNQITLYLALPAIWLAAELGSSLAFSVFLLGPGSNLGVPFSMGYIGYLLGEHDLLIQFASVFGAYGLSFLYVAFAASFLWLYQNGYLKYAASLLFILVVSSGVSFVAEPDMSNTYKVAVVETTLPSRQNNEPNQFLDLNQAALQAAKNTEADYIIFPEDARVFDQSLDEDFLRAVLAFKNSDTEAVIIDSGRVDLETGSVTQALIFDASNKDLFKAQKRYLVPQGEYLPYVYSSLFQLFGQAKMSDTLQERLSYRIGPQTSQSEFKDGIPSVLFCFEVVDPSGIKRSLSERSSKSPFIAHILSQAWIHHSEIFQKQLETMLRVQAIWNDTYIVSAANDATSYTITEKGQVIYPEIVHEDEYWKLRVMEIPVR